MNHFQKTFFRKFFDISNKQIDEFTLCPQVFATDFSKLRLFMTRLFRFFFFLLLKKKGFKTELILFGCKFRNNKENCAHWSLIN